MLMCEIIIWSVSSILFHRAAHVNQILFQYPGSAEQGFNQWEKALHTHRFIS